ncbi:MAG TPA: LysM peptidoglycan-binding domain-containing protein [Candidatus Brachybacterium intestinipullorum]|uniref:LysM peptidoglycan-binding domain-containing protein n=1 Tax=Candidatus Brachybacterium intestinipullorum TaxID=2838512 RepID=A0A9D2TGE9_9MICO|nr:LysM peptidoglycan-binding domain-containing protein [Candidatus Brachybacterium intestinipullorum]
MGDSGQAQGARGAGTSLLGTVLAGGGACAMSAAAASLRRGTRGVHGQEQLIGWVLLGLAAAGALLCLYLALVWALAAAIQLAGPAGRLGRMLLPALRVLAPRLARRVSMGAAVATAATGLVLGPALASEQVPGGPEERPTVLQTSQLLPEEDPVAAHESEDGPEEPLPSLGWGGDPAQGAAEPETADTEEPPAEETAAGAGAGDEDAPRGAQESTDSKTPPAGVPEESDAPDGGDAAAQDHGSEEGTGRDADEEADSTRRTVVVQPGDSLWSITDDVLGPAPEDPALLASSWPLLHEANRAVIGDDPDLLRPGQVLTVPAALDEEAAS